MKKMIKTVYLAGPGVFYKDPLAHGDALKKQCLEMDMVGLFPMDALLDISNMGPHEAAAAIYQANIRMIDQCDAVVADMQVFRGPGMDGGTAFEMGYAKALGKPVIGYGSSSNYLKRCREYYGDLQEEEGSFYDPSGLSVESFELPDNLMMACGADGIVGDFRAALAYLANL